MSTRLLKKAKYSPCSSPSPPSKSSANLRGGNDENVGNGASSSISSSPLRGGKQASPFSPHYNAATVQARAAHNTVNSGVENADEKGRREVVGTYEAAVCPSFAIR